MTPNPLSKVTVAFISVSRPQELSWDEELGGVCGGGGFCCWRDYVSGHLISGMPFSF